MLVHAAEVSDELAAQILSAGARALVRKQAPPKDVLRALHALVGGQVYVDAALAGASDAARPRIDLTAREREVLTLLARGCGQREIGERLSIDTETVLTHIEKAQTRLSARTPTQAVANAIRLGLVR
jgi:two-component system, NarL family, nitrate/nitrite response regulator NarL